MISYRQAMLIDADAASKLLLEVSFISRFLYGSTYPETDLIQKISEAFKNEYNKISYKNTYVAVINENSQDQIIGLVNYYDAKNHKIDTQMQQQFSSDIISTLEPFYASIVTDSLYISALIVKENYRNYNIGVQLIQHVINKAKEKNYRHVCLHVWEDNPRGIRFYQKNHFNLYHAFTLNTDSLLLPPSKKLWLAGIDVF